MTPVRPSFVSLEIAPPDPVAVATALGRLPHGFLLHSGAGGSRGRWSFFGAEPFDVFGPDRYSEALALWRGFRPAAGGAPGEPGEPPFKGGLVGCWSYDFGRRLEKVPTLARDDAGWPDVWLAAYDVVGAIDQVENRAWLFSSGQPATGAEGRRRAAERLEEFRARLEASPRTERESRVVAPTSIPPARSTFSPDAFRAAVESVREHIRRGDIFQANLSQRWTVPCSGPVRDTGLALFGALAAHSPAPFATWLDLGDFVVASASPERFLEVRGRTVETRPIKGTRPRSADPAEDARLAAALRASAKDRAENVMIVDVLRNDLGRVCETGSVIVPELCALESFAQVHHLTSTVRGTLRTGAGGGAHGGAPGEAGSGSGSGADAVDLLHACFPGGSITGAPKIRAMEVIETLEPVRRGLYTGAIGYLDWSGDADWNIAIRTAAVTPGAIRFAAGGGITADSDPDAEFRETLAKAEGWRLAMAALGLPVELELEPREIGT